MTQRINVIDPVNSFKNKIYGKQPKKKSITNKTDVYLFDDTWSGELLDLNDYCSEKKDVTDIFW